MSTRRCGFCREQGHDRRSCPNAEVFRQRELLQKQRLDEKQGEKQKKIQKERDRNASVKASIKFSCLSLFPSLEKGKIDIYYAIWEDEHYSRCHGHQSKVLNISHELSLLHKWTQTLYDDIHDPKHPIRKFHLHLPLSFWVAMLREVTSVIHKQCKKRLDRVNEIFTGREGFVYLDINVPLDHYEDKLCYWNQYTARSIFKLCDKMRKTSIDCIEKMVPETRLTLKLLPEHVRHVLSYL